MPTQSTSARQLSPALEPLDLRAGGVREDSVSGVYGRAGALRRVLEALRRTIEQLAPEAERVTFPPVMPRADLDRVGYFKNFPHLLGSVACFCGGDNEHRQALKAQTDGADWARVCEPTDLVLTPAACYPAYPAVAREGDVGGAGRLLHVSSWCFRHEPSNEPGRLQSFEMHEYVRVGAPDQVLEFRQRWMERGTAFLADLGVAGELAAANDPFFGRAAGVMAQSQRALQLKYELLAQLAPESKPAACMSFNYHLDHFGQAFGLRCDGEVAHTACVGFGPDRLALALFHQHGADPDGWPVKVQSVLGLRGTSVQ